MYSVDSLEYAVRHLFQGGIGEHGYSETEVETLLHGIDFEALLQAVRHNAQTVHAYTTEGKAPMSFNYRGRDLFGQRATRLYEDNDQNCASIVLTDRTYELWLLEDMDLVAVACVPWIAGTASTSPSTGRSRRGTPGTAPCTWTWMSWSMRSTQCAPPTMRATSLSMSCNRRERR